MWASLRGALAPGSYLVLCHGTDEGKPGVARAGEKVYDRSVGAAAHALPGRNRAVLRWFRTGQAGAAQHAGLATRSGRRYTGRGIPADQSRFWGGLAGGAAKTG